MIMNSTLLMAFLLFRCLYDDHVAWRLAHFFDQVDQSICRSTMKVHNIHPVLVLRDSRDPGTFSKCHLAHLSRTLVEKESKQALKK